MRTLATIATVWGVLILTAGCANYTRPQTTVWPGGPGEDNFQAVWQASLDVLEKYNFRIDRKDRRAGVITTRPMLARHWFEFWRRDAVTTYDLAEGTLQTVTRRATVRIEPLDEFKGVYQPVVVVEVARPDRGGMEIIAASEAYDRFLDSYDTLDTDYERHKRLKKLKKSIDYTRQAEGDRAADEFAEDARYQQAPPELLGQQDALARQLTAEIRAEAAKRTTP